MRWGLAPAAFRDRCAEGDAPNNAGFAATGASWGLISAPAPAQPTTGSAAVASTELQEIVVTGSLIKRTDTETPSPVRIITDLDIENSGYTNVSDVLRTLSANGSGTFESRASVRRLRQEPAASRCAAYRWATRSL